MSTIKVNNIDPRNTGETVSVNGLAMPNAGTLANRNKIINGDMRIAQRGTAAVTATGAYPVDRFRQLVGNTAGAVTFQQETTDVPAGFDYATKGTVTTADATTDATQRWSIDQKIEGYNVADLRFGTADAKSVTLSFWVKSSVAGVYCASLLGASTRGFVNEYTINSANTWEYKTITVPGDTSGTWVVDNGTGLQVFFSLTGGSSLQGTAGSWQSNQKECTSNQTQLLQTLSATWLVAGVQLEAGTNATPFEYRDYGYELASCQRYFQLLQFGSGVGLNSTTIARQSWPLRVTMRANMTIEKVGTATWFYGTGNASINVIGSNYSKPNVAQVDLTVTTTGGALTNAAPCFIESGPNDYFTASAEL